MGIAWHNPEQATMICLPVPLNWIAGWARNFWYKVRWGPSNKRDAAIFFALGKEYGEGFKDGQLEATRAYKQLIDKYF